MNILNGSSCTVVHTCYFITQMQFKSLAGQGIEHEYDFDRKLFKKINPSQKLLQNMLKSE